MRCDIMTGGDPLEIELPDEFLAMIKRDDETEVTLCQGFFVQEGVVVFVAVRIEGLPMARTRFALAHADLFGAHIEATWAAEKAKGLPTYEALRDRLTTKLEQLQAQRPVN